MASNTQAITPRYVQSAGAKITTAQTDQTGTTATNVVTVYTAKSTSAAGSTEGQGALVQDITIRVPVTSLAAVVAIFKRVGAVRFLLRTVSVSAITVSVSVPGFDSGKIVLNEFLNQGDSIDVLTTVTQETHAVVNVGEY